MKSVLLILLFAIVCTSIIFNEDRGSKNQFTSDRLGYYIHLPAVFIYHDLANLRFYDSLDIKYGRTLELGYLLHDVNGKKLNKYPVGVALFELPLFIDANLYCQVDKSYAQDGLTAPYQFAGIFSNILWVVAGLFVLRRFLRKYFSDSITTLTLLAIAFGTNLYTYSTFETGMSHPYSFFLFCCLLYLIDIWYTKGWRNGTSILIGLVLGLIFIVRPINIIAVVLVLAWKVYNYSSLTERVKFFRKHCLSTLPAAAAFAIIVFIQLAYWKYITGHWFYYAYEGERFTFLRPHVLAGLFSYRKGWFVYTPMAMLGLLSLFYLQKTRKGFAPAILIFFVLMIYAVFSWEQWWYGNSFGCRPLIETVGVLALPIASSIEHFMGLLRSWKKYAYFSLLFFFVTLNIFQSYQYSMGLISGNRMTGAYYWRIFGQADSQRDQYEKYLLPDGEKE